MSEDMVHRASDAASAAIGQATAPVRDLQQFCSKEQFRFSLHKPFSFGPFSYATDGIMAVRVPRRDDVPEAKHAKIPQAALTVVAAVSCRVADR